MTLDASRVRVSPQVTHLSAETACAWDATPDGQQRPRGASVQDAPCADSKRRWIHRTESCRSSVMSHSMQRNRAVAEPPCPHHVLCTSTLPSMSEVCLLKLSPSLVMRMPVIATGVSLSVATLYGGQVTGRLLCAIALTVLVRAPAPLPQTPKSRYSQCTLHIDSAKSGSERNVRCEGYAATLRPSNECASCWSVAHAQK